MQVPQRKFLTFINFLGLTLPNRISVHNLNLPINMEEKVHCNDLLQGLVQHFFTRKYHSVLNIIEPSIELNLFVMGYLRRFF